MPRRQSHSDIDSYEFCRLNSVSQINMVANGEVMAGIRMDPKSDVTRCCFWCGTPVDILLVGKLTKKQRETLREDMSDGASASIVIGHDPCTACAEVMSRGICLVESVTVDGETFPSGRYWVLTEEAIRKLINLPGLADRIISRKRALIGQETAQKIGLYDGEPVRRLN